MGAASLACQRTFGMHPLSYDARIQLWLVAVGLVAEPETSPCRIAGMFSNNVLVHGTHAVCGHHVLMQGVQSRVAPRVSGVCAS